MLASLLPARYAKAIAAAVGQALTVVQLIYGHNTYVAIGLAVAAALGVYAVPNSQPSPPAPPGGAAANVTYTLPPLQPAPDTQGYSAMVSGASLLAVRVLRDHRPLPAVRRRFVGLLDRARALLPVHAAAARRPAALALPAAAEQLMATWHPRTPGAPAAVQQLSQPRVSGGRITTLEAIRAHYERADQAAAVMLARLGWATT